MDYLKWIAVGLQLIAFFLFFASFAPLGRRRSGDESKFFFRPWPLAYGIVIFVLASLLDVIVKMKFLG